MVPSYIDDFEKLYSERIYPDLKGAESIRKNIVLNYSIIGAVVFGGMLVEAITWMSIAIVFIILFVLVYTRWYGIPVSRYEKAYIEAITSNIIHYIHPDLKIDNSSHLKLQELKNANIITLNPEYFAGKNLIYGNIDDEPVRISEISATTKYTKENGVENIFEYFNGIILVADLKPEINGNVLILSNNTLVKQYADFGQWIKLEKRDNNEFVVYGTDDNAVIKYADNKILNTLKNFHERSGRDIIYSVYEEGICLGILQNPKFSYLNPSVFKSAYNKKEIENYYNDLNFLVRTVYPHLKY